MPAIEQVELDRDPVLAVPNGAVARARVAEQPEPVGRDMVDIFLDDDFYELDDVDVPRGLEDALVVPFETGRNIHIIRVGRFEDAAKTVVLAQE